MRFLALLCFYHLSTLCRNVLPTWMSVQAVQRSELEFQMVVTHWVLGIEPSSSTKATSTLNTRVISPALRNSELLLCTAWPELMSSAKCVSRCWIRKLKELLKLLIFSISYFVLIIALISAGVSAVAFSWGRGFSFSYFNIIVCIPIIFKWYSQGQNSFIPLNFSLPRPCLS